MNSKHAVLFSIAAILFFLLSVMALASMEWGALAFRSITCASFTLLAAVASRSRE